MVFADTSDGKLKEVTAGEQIVGWCRELKTDEYGRTVAVIEACPVLQVP